MWSKVKDELSGSEAMGVLMTCETKSVIWSHTRGDRWLPQMMPTRKVFRADIIGAGLRLGKGCSIEMVESPEEAKVDD